MTDTNREVLSVGLSSDQKLVASKLPYTYADLIVDYLAQIGVEYLFGLQGGAIEPFFNGVARRRKKGGMLDKSSDNRAQSRKRDAILFGPKPVFSRNECSAAFMADGYNRETGKLGVCCATAGPGSTNLLTGVATAFQDNIPMLVITPQTALPSFGRGALQESTKESVDIVSMFDHCTYYSTLVSHASQLERKLIHAIIRAFSFPRGPVHLSIPMDVMNEVIEQPLQLMNIATLLRQPNVVDPQAFKVFEDEVLSSIQSNKKLVFVLGSGCADAAEDIMAFAAITGSAIVSSPTGKRWVDPYHPNYKGVFGFSGHESARAALEDPDVIRIIAVGTTLGETETAGWDDAVFNEKLIHVEAHAHHFSRSSMAFLHLQGCLKLIFENLLATIRRAVVAGDVADRMLESKTSLTAVSTIEDIDTEKFLLPKQITYDAPEKCLDNQAPIKPQSLMMALSSLLPSNTRFLTDAGGAMLWGLHYLCPRERGNHRLALGFGTMGWAIGACIGTAIARKDTPVVCLTGDGSWLMSGQEFIVAVEQQLPILFVLLNDNGFGTIRHGQILGGAERVGTESPFVDFAAVARAYGGEGIVINSPVDLAELDFEKLFSAAGPTLLDVRIDQDEVPPLGERMKVLCR